MDMFVKFIVRAASIAHSCEIESKDIAVDLFHKVQDEAWLYGVKFNGDMVLIKHKEYQHVNG